MCEQSFSTKYLLSSHEKTCGLKLVCSCGASYKSLETLQTHARRFSHTIPAWVLQVVRARKQMHPLTVHVPVLADPCKVTQYCKNHEHDNSYSSGSEQTDGESKRRLVDIVPKTMTSHPHSTHFLAAIALSEMAASAIRKPCVDMGTQTDSEMVRRTSKKSISPVKSCEISVNPQKRKCNTETQTRPAGREGKKARVIAQTQTTYEPILHVAMRAAHLVVVKESKGSQCGVFNSNEVKIENPCTNIATFADESQGMFPSQSCTTADFLDLKSVAGNELHNKEVDIDIDFPELFTSHRSTSGTQTSPRCSIDLGILDGIELTTSSEDFKLDLLEPTGSPHKEAEMSSPKVTKNPLGTHVPSSVDLDPFATSQLLIDDDMEFIPVVVEQQRKPPSLGENRSFSIETQTDHDVLLSKNAECSDDTDDIICANIETQTDISSFLLGANIGPCDNSDDILCSNIETQTYEDFSDQEQFLYSNIHTQTGDNDSMLFPELSFAATQTQTSIGCMTGAPAFVNTQTQTSILGLGPNYGKLCNM